MKLSVARLLADTLELELPAKGSDIPNVVLLKHGVNVRGTIDTKNGTRLEHVTAEALDIGQGHWRFGDHTLALGPITLETVDVDLFVPKAGKTTGSIKAASLHGFAADFVIGPVAAGEKIHVDRIHAKDITVGFTPQGVTIEVGALELGIGQARLGPQDLGWRDVIVTRLAVTIPDGDRTTIAVGELVLDGIAAVLERVLPRNEDETADARIAEAEEDLREANDPAERHDRPLAPDVDWSFLDTISGKIDLDLALDVSVPLIKHFKGKNEFRIPIEAGVIDYKKTEHQLTTLVDTFIDLELTDHRLILEKDIPLVPEDEKTILYWPLTDDEQALAAGDKIRLSTLMHAVKPGRSAEELQEQAEDAAEDKAEALEDKAEGEPAGKKTIRLLGLDLENVDVNLVLGRTETPLGGGTLTIGGAGRGGALGTGGTLTVTGDFRYRAEGDAAADPGELHVALKDLILGARGVTLGDGATLSGSVRGNIDDVVVRVGGQAPQSLALRTEQITFSDASLALGKKAA